MRRLIMITRIKIWRKGKSRLIHPSVYLPTGVSDGVPLHHPQGINILVGSVGLLDVWNDRLETMD